MSGLEFTAAAARQLEKIYLTKDIVAQRLHVIKHLGLSEGERVLDMVVVRASCAKRLVRLLVVVGLSSVLIFLPI